MNKHKELTINHLLEQHNMITITVRPSKNTILPEYLMDNKFVVLNIGLRDIHPPISDLQTDSQGVSGTLSFNGKLFHCEIPWESLVMVIINNSDTILWSTKDTKTSDKKEEKKKSSHLKLIN